jgi:hypothetical protein
MPKTPTPGDAVALLQDALATGHTVLLSLSAPPRVNRTPPLATTCRRAFGLTLAEALVFAELLAHGQSERGPLQDAMSHNGTRAPTTKSLSVLMCKLRRKLAVHGITIDLLWGQGYALAGGARARAHEILAAHGETAIEQAALMPD